MTFGIRTELLLDGAWVDVSGDVYDRDPVRISRGRPDEASTADPSSCSLTLNNRDGKYSPRNPRSPYFGKLGRNTPIRVSLPDYGTSIFRVDPATYGGAEITAPDSAALSVTGDIDIRVDMALVDWDTGGLSVLVAKSGGSGNAGWLFGFGYSGFMIPFLQWSADGVASTLKSGTAAFDLTDGARGCLRMTMDVDNGAGGSTLTFYQGETMDGPWTVVGSPVVTAGTTGLFDNTAPVRFGYNGGYPLQDGDYYGFEIRNGINGTVVASPDFTAHAGSPTSFPDEQGNTWTVVNAELTVEPEVRFEGEVVAWPLAWDVSGADSWVSIDAAGITRRLNQGSTELDSPVFARMLGDQNVTFPAGVRAYWPLEEDQGANRAYSPIAGVSPADTPGFSYGQDAPVCSAPLPQAVAGTNFNALVPAYPAGSEWAVSWLQYIPEMPTGAAEVALMRVRSTGTVTRHNVYISNAGISIKGYRSDPNEGLHGDDLVYASSTPLGPGFVYPGEWVVARLECFVSGGVCWASFMIERFDGTNHVTDATYSGTPGVVSRIYNTGWPTELDGMGIGHVTVYDDSASTVMRDAADAFDGETVDARILRLGDQTGTPISVQMDEAALAQMGPQPRATLLGALEECATVDGGMLYETREGRELVYRARDTLYNQTPALTLTYGQAAPPLLPVDDDQHIRNDVTVSRYTGTKARHVDTTSALSVLAPPLGVGRYDTEIDANLYTDDALPAHAEWAVHLGTWDESRYPEIRVNLAASPELAADALAVDILDRIQVTNLPVWLPPDPIDAIVQGYTETLSLTSWDIVFNCSPARPWDTGVLDDVDYGRADTDGSELATGVDMAATSLSVAVTDGPLWTTAPAEFPFDVTVGGERMTVTAISGTVSPQTFTVTRGVNGMTLAHATGADVRLAQPARVAW